MGLPVTKYDHERACGDLVPICLLKKMEASVQNLGRVHGDLLKPEQITRIYFLNGVHDLSIFFAVRQLPRTDARCACFPRNLTTRIATESINSLIDGENQNGGTPRHTAFIMNNHCKFGILMRGVLPSI